MIPRNIGNTLRYNSKMFCDIYLCDQFSNIFSGDFLTKADKSPESESEMTLVPGTRLFMCLLEYQNCNLII